MSRRLRLGFVSAFPPARRPLSEYAWHVVQRLARSPRIECVHVFADRTAEPTPSCAPGVVVDRCWTFNGIDEPVAVARAARRARVDALWFNLHLTSGGNTRASWLAGLAAPAAAKAAGFTTVVTLHNMLGCTDVRWAGPETRWFDRAAAHGLTALLRVADVVCVLVPEYVHLLRSRYGLRRVELMPFGALGTPAETPSTVDPAHPALLAFGHFGSYKRLEPLMDVMAAHAATDRALSLVVAGIDSRHSGGYLEGLLNRYGHPRNVSYEGYVPESKVCELFRRSTLCILPYTTTAGTSGVAMQAAMYGVPIVASDVPGLRSLRAAGLRMDFFDWRDRESLARTIQASLADPERRFQDAQHNLAYMRRQQMDSVVDRYLDVIEGELATGETAGPRETIAMSAVE